MINNIINKYKGIDMKKTRNTTCNKYSFSSFLLILAYPYNYHLHSYLHLNWDK